jgi:hypothetical protein
LENTTLVPNVIQASRSRNPILLIRKEQIRCKRGEKF